MITRLTLLAATLLVLSAGAAFVTMARSSGDDSSQQPANVTTVSNTDSTITRLRQQLGAHPDDAQAYTQLGAAYLRKVRETGDPAYYSTAETALEKAIALRPDDPDALTVMAALALARHDFAGALAIAQRSDVDDADRYGVLGDTLLELGRYDEAFAAFQHMIDLRPDLASYTRVAYARELTGDVDGAIEAMRRAVEAGGMRGEGVAWTLVQLGHLEFNRGDLDAAQAEYERALDAFAGFLPALAGTARIDAARGDYVSAIATYTTVTERYPAPEYVTALGDVYAAADREVEAQQQFDLVLAIDQLYRANGVNTDLELALFFADHDVRLDEAVAQARAVYAERPSVHAADVLAWTLYKAGDAEEALAYSNEALRLGSRDPQLLFHAGMVRQANGDAAGAREYLQQALGANPRFSVLHAGTAAAALDELQALAAN
jgi:tetratricopeptide (TPR) repeat protein